MEVEVVLLLLLLVLLPLPLETVEIMDLVPPAEEPEDASTPMPKDVPEQSTPENVLAPATLNVVLLVVCPPLWSRC